MRSCSNKPVQSLELRFPAPLPLVPDRGMELDDERRNREEQTDLGLTYVDGVHLRFPINIAGAALTQVSVLVAPVDRLQASTRARNEEKGVAANESGGILSFGLSLHNHVVHSLDG